ncbi:MAG: helix-turn-helix domain-containing protein [Candidatus Uhrbacteria bacterium]
MYSELLQELNLSPNEAKIYEGMLSTGETNASVIALRSNVPRRNVYDTLNRLIEKGLVYKIIGSGENLFQAVHPNKLLDLLQEKEKWLKNKLPELQDLYETEPPLKAAYIYSGVEGYKNYHNDLLRVSQKEEVYFLGAKALWNSPQINKSFRTNYLKEFEKRKVPYYTLFDPGVLRELPEVVQKAKGEYKILPDQYATQGLVDIFGDYVVTFSGVHVGRFDDNLRIFIIIDKDLANTYRTWFKMIWNLLPGNSWIEVQKNTLLKKNKIVF